MYNRIEVIGRVVRDTKLVELEESTVANFTVAVNQRRLRKGERVDEVTYFDCAIWNGGAKAFQPYLKKGTVVHVDSDSFEINTYESNIDHELRSNIKLNVRDITLLPSQQSTETEE